MGEGEKPERPAVKREAEEGWAAEHTCRSEAVVHTTYRADFNCGWPSGVRLAFAAENLKFRDHKTN